MGGSESSSEEEDATWKAAIESIATTTALGSNKSSAAHSTSNNAEDDGGREHYTQNPQKLKHYQLKAQKLLDEMLDKTLEVVRDPVDVLDKDRVVSEGGVRLFKRSPVGIVFDYRDEIQRPTKRPRILPGQFFNDKSKKFRQQIRTVVVDGVDIIAAARDAGQRSLARFEAKEAAAKEKAKKEEERVAELKRIRGERWLPSVAKEMQLNRGSSGQVQANIPKPHV